MKTLLTPLLALAVIVATAQTEPGYRPAEARDMIALCNSFTFLKEVGSDDEIIPEGYERVFDSESVGLDNRFQVYTHDNTAVIVIRGTTANPMSWMANVYSAMIPAESIIKINGFDHSYKMAEDPDAAVHSGYALGVVLMADAVLEQLAVLNDTGITDFLITGHSQGGSLATMLRAYLENLPPEKLGSDYQFKTYAFAGPMVGNEYFAREYDRRFSDKQTAFRIENRSDMVPSFPSGMSENGATPLDMFADRSSGNDFRTALLAALFTQFNDSIAQFANQMGANLLKQFSGSIGEIEMPEYVEAYDYKPAGQLVTIEPVPFSTAIREGEVDTIQEPRMYQHKPYIYYRSLLLENFPEQHRELKRLIPPGVE